MRIKVSEGYVEEGTPKDAQCPFHYMTECIGFEGVLKHMCKSKTHPHATSIYPVCNKDLCKRPILFVLGNAK